MLRFLLRRLKNDFFCLFAKRRLNTIYVFGDSHGNYCFQKLMRQHINLSCNSITMHRVGRDGIPFSAIVFVTLQMYLFFATAKLIAGIT